MADIAKITTTRDAAKAVAATDWKTGAATQTIDFAGVKDEKFLLYVKNTSSTAGDDVKLTIKKSGGPFGAVSDYVTTVGDGEECVIGPLTSANWKAVSGSNLGKVTITLAAATQGGAGAASDISFLPIVLGA